MITFLDGPHVKNVMLEEGDYVENTKISKMIHQYYSCDKDVVSEGAFLIIAFIDEEGKHREFHINDKNRDLRDHVKAASNLYFKSIADYPFKRAKLAQ